MRSVNAVAADEREDREDEGVKPGCGGALLRDDDRVEDFVNAAGNNGVSVRGLARGLVVLGEDAVDSLYESKSRRGGRKKPEPVLRVEGAQHSQLDADDKRLWVEAVSELPALSRSAKRQVCEQ